MAKMFISKTNLYFYYHYTGSPRTSL